MILVFLRGIVFGDGVVNIQLAPSNELALKVSHGILGMANIVVRYHHKPTVLALSVHGPDWTVHLKQLGQFVILHIGINVANEQSA